MVQCVAAGHEIVGVAHLRPPGPIAREIGKSKATLGARQGFFICLLVIQGFMLLIIQQTLGRSWLGYFLLNIDIEIVNFLPSDL
jgi:hypothetical protein